MVVVGGRLIETWDVLKWCMQSLGYISDRINRNMGCIEIIDSPHSKFPVFGLIETWDVLKCVSRYTSAEVLKINRNMGCIEMDNIFSSI